MCWKCNFILANAYTECSNLSFLSPILFSLYLVLVSYIFFFLRSKCWLSLSSLTLLFQFNRSFLTFTYLYVYSFSWLCHFGLCVSLLGLLFLLFLFDFELLLCWTSAGICFFIMSVNCDCVYKINYNNNNNNNNGQRMHKHIVVIHEMLGAGEWIQCMYTSMSSSLSNTSHITEWTRTHTLEKKNYKKHQSRILKNTGGNFDGGSDDGHGGHTLAHIHN